MGLLNKILGDPNEKYLRKIQPILDKINSLEKKFEEVETEKFKEKTLEFKNRINKGESLDDILPEAFALVREASKRTLNQRHYDVQIIGGIVLHQGKISEMKTGEGKTLSSTLPLYLNALTGKGCHLVTVNDYLAKRDAVWMGQIYDLLGLTTSCITNQGAFLYDSNYKNKDDQESTRDEERDTKGGFSIEDSYLKPCERKEAYKADITYGTNNEFGFDYLRDNLVYDLNNKSQRGFHFAIVDEVDSILIDEARTPLIISAPDTESSKWYQDFARIIPQLDSETDYNMDEKSKSVSLTEEGINRIEKILNLDNIYEEKGIKYLHHIEQALRAQAINPVNNKPFFAKNVNYIVKNGEIIIIDEFTGRLMPGRRWSGGLHQAIEAKEGVEVKPESLTLASITFQNLFRMYEKLSGMTGTAITSAEEFDKVYKLDVVIIPTNKLMIRKDLSDLVFKTQKGKIQALVNEIKERHSKGQPLLVGTRSVEKNEYLGKLLEREGIKHQILNAKHHEKEGEIIAQAGKLNAVTIATNMAGRGVDIILGGNPPDSKEAEKIRELGGLYVIGTERHEARRIDDQLRGRAGRQGDPGVSRFFLSLEDDLMRIFGGDRIQSMMGILKVPEDQPIEAKLITGAIESAQAKIESMNFEARKHLLDYDDVLNKHREIIYKKRNEILEAKEIKTKIKAWIQEAEEKKLFENKEKELGEKFNYLAKIVSLRTIDMLWMNHLENMESLRDSVKLRAYGQKDPLVEYKNEGHKMFKELLSVIENNIIKTILQAGLRNQSEKPRPIINLNERESSASSKDKIGRNDPCPCGSGKKYKKCCGK